VCALCGMGAEDPRISGYRAGSKTKNRSLTVAALIGGVFLGGTNVGPTLGDEPRSPTPPASAVSDPATTDEPGKKDSDATTEGLWPSKRLLRSLLARRAEDLSRENGFDDEQKSKSREVIVDGWSQFLGDRREQLQPLFNEFLEMRLDVEAPAKERVRAWAEKAGPVFDELRERAGTSVDDLRKIVKPEQRIAFEAEALKIRAGLALAGTKLQQWRGGDFDPKEFWEPLPSERRRERSERESANASKESDTPGKPATESPDAVPAEPTVDDQIDAELKSWDRYVADFSERNRLDSAQRDAVRSCLSELKERASAHRDRHREEIAQLERRIAASQGGTEEVEGIGRDVITLYGPVDEMFAELKRRIEPIPTSEQRDIAEKRGNVGAPVTTDPGSGK